MKCWVSGAAYGAVSLTVSCKVHDHLHASGVWEGACGGAIASWVDGPRFVR